VVRSCQPGVQLAQDSGEFVLLSRILVSLVAAFLIVIPWSERYGMLDNFPHGQDTEFSLLAFLIFLGLMLLLARSCTRFLGALMTWCEALSTLLLNDPLLLPAIHPLPRGESHEHPPGVSQPAFNLPLQI
jgi:hypothetical protein